MHSAVAADTTATGLLPCWVMRMFHPKWGLIQSTVSPCGGERAGREQTLGIIYKDN